MTRSQFYAAKLVYPQLKFRKSDRQKFHKDRSIAESELLWHRRRLDCGVDPERRVRERRRRRIDVGVGVVFRFLALLLLRLVFCHRNEIVKSGIGAELLFDVGQHGLLNLGEQDPVDLGARLSSGVHQRQLLRQ